MSTSFFSSWFVNELAEISTCLSTSKVKSKTSTSPPLVLFVVVVVVGGIVVIELDAITEVVDNLFDLDGESTDVETFLETAEDCNLLEVEVLVSNTRSIKK